jgi:hypothetical protein
MKGCPECQQTQAMLQEWIDQQGHDRCWYYPDIFMKLVKLFGITTDGPPQLPPRKEFEAGCKKYQTQEYGKQPL